MLHLYVCAVSLLDPVREEGRRKGRYRENIGRGGTKRGKRGDQSATLEKVSQIWKSLTKHATLEEDPSKVPRKIQPRS